jgi:hypothetical protein
MDDLERRVIVLEQQVRHERELSDWRYAALSRQLLEAQASPLRQIPSATTVKVFVAILLPLTVLLATGDLRKALAAAARLAGG